MKLLFSTRSKLAPVLCSTIPVLIFGVLLATASGIAALGGLWCILQLITEYKVFWLVAAFVLWTVSALLSGSASLINHHAEAIFSGRLRRYVAEHLVRLPSSILTKYKGEKLKRLMADDISSLHHMIAHLPSELATFIIVPTITIVFLIYSAGAIALLALIPGVIAALFYLILVPRLASKQGDKRVNVMGDITAAVDDYTRGAPIFKIYGTQAGAMTDYTKATRYFINDIVERVSRVSTPVAVATSLLQAVSTFAIVYAIGYEWPTEKLAAALFFSLAIVTPALKLGHGLDYLVAGRSAAKRLIDFLEQSQLPVGNCKVKHISNMPLSLIDVVPSLFHTHQFEPINYQFKVGQVTAITGVSGIGKSILLRLLSGFEPLRSGNIRLADVSLSEMDEMSLNHLIMLVPQSSGVLAASIADNLALTAPDATNEVNIAALKSAQLDKPLNTHASNLSGGEVQRVNLARVFLSNAPIILLDEPTSALDNETALHVFAALRHEAKVNNKTIVIVTHDLTLAQLADNRFSLNTYYREENNS